MKRVFQMCLLAAWVAAGLMLQPGFAQEPNDILDHYRLIPRLSTLHQTGGFAGFNLSYRLTGEYDLRHGPSSEDAAAFENAEVWGSLISDGPAPAVVIDVDEILNLEGLEGTALPIAAPFDIYRFHSRDAEDSSIELFAAVLGQWMYIRGGTQPPPGGADFITYDIRALAHSKTHAFADFNEDGTVDAADYASWRDSGRTGGYADWQQQFGKTVPDLTAVDTLMSAAISSYAAAAAIPEPACFSLAICGGLFVARLRLRSHHQRGFSRH